MRGTYDMNVIVPIPEGGHKCSDNRVYVVTESRYYPDLKFNMDKRLWIGKAINDKQMHPNDTYKRYYADQMAAITHMNLPVYHKKIGLYAVVLSIAEKKNLYPILIEYSGPQNANIFMDNAFFSIVTKENAVKGFDEEMTDRMHFLDKPYSDTWMGKKFGDDITDDQIQASKNAWVKEFTEEQLKGVWICVDGSNNDCTADVDEAEKGKAKSHKNINIISFLYAVTEDGTPIASQVYRGSRVDAKALQEMVWYLKGYGITPRGFALDRGFCDENCISLLDEKGYDYVIKLKENTYGFQTLMQKYQSELKFRWKYALGNHMYGAGEEVQVFKTAEIRKHCVLLWDARNGGMRTDYLVDGVMETIGAAEEAIAAGRVPDIPDKYRQYLEVKEDKLEVHEDLLQKEMDEKGFSGLICSDTFTAKEANRIYGLRNSSEKQYSILKSQLGGDTFRVHSMHKIRVKEMIAFVASIIRNEIQKTCKQAKLDTNKVIKELDLITIDMNPEGSYEVIWNKHSELQRRILSLFSVTPEDLKRIAEFENKRIHKEMYSPIQTLAVKEEEKVTTVRIEGKPEGSKAVGKGARSPKKEKSKRGPGRPRKNPEVKRGRGRPPGSKNKPKDPNAQPVVKRGRGRPKGSKNKPKE